MRAMVFIDYQNFTINLKKYYKNKKIILPKIKYVKLAQEIIKQIDLQNVHLVKTYLFAAKPCDKLLEHNTYRNINNQLNELKCKKHLEVIEGIQVIRQPNPNIDIDLNDKSTFYTEEKGTDVNIAVNMISKAYMNAYDVAILVSGDSDYVPVVKQLNNIGKTVILATIPGQSIENYKELYSQHIHINDALIKRSNGEVIEK